MTRTVLFAVILGIAIAGCGSATTEGGDGEITATWTAGDDEPLEQPEEAHGDGEARDPEPEPER